MDDLILRVELRSRYGGPIEAREVVLEGQMVREAAQKIDHADQSADVFTKMICTLPSVKRDVEIKREEVADIASQAASSMVKKFAGSHDTKMGYKIRLTG